MRSDLYEDFYKKEDTYWWHRGRRMFVDTLLRDRIKPGAKLKILDVGCGCGRQMEELKKLGDVSGFDIAPEALDFCSQRGLKQVQQADLNQTLPYGDNSFDLIVALDVLEHVENDNFALSQIYRILKPNGIFLMSVPAHPKLWSYWDKIIFHKRRYQKMELQKKLEQADFRILRLSFTHSFVFLPTIMMRKLRGLVFGRKDQKATSDFIILPNFLNQIMVGGYWLENQIFRRVNIPFGLSLMAVARK